MAPRIVVLTGAGISAESGIPTFRDGNGLWNAHRVEDVASPDGFARDPDLVHAFYDRRRRDAASVHPNPAHYALAELEQELTSRGAREGVLVVTQNVDDLHERAGSRNVIHMHGELNSALCMDCGARHPWHEDLADRPPCPACGEPALRPDIVWFGELVYRLDEIEDAIDRCGTLIVVGTSATVWPAAGFAARARARGVETILVNLDAHDDLFDFGDVRLGPASILVPDLVAEILGGDGGDDADDVG